MEADPWKAFSLLQGVQGLFFPNSSFIKAELRCNPSFTRRNLLVARELIKAGTAWKVGDGQSIEVVDHRWLIHPPQFKPSANRNMKVANLIDHHTRQWNKPLHYTTFLQSTMKNI